MAEVLPISRSATAAGHVLGRKLDSIPFSPYHLMILGVLGLVGFIDGYDLVMTGSLLVLAKTAAASIARRRPFSRHRLDA